MGVPNELHYRFRRSLAQVAHWWEHRAELIREIVARRRLEVVGSAAHFVLDLVSLVGIGIAVDRLAQLLSS